MEAADSEVSTVPFWLKFLTEAGISVSHATNYAIIFDNHRIQPSMAADLNKEYLIDMGVCVMGDIIAILKKAKAVDTSPLNVGRNSPSTVTPSTHKSTALSRIINHYTGRQPTTTSDTTSDHISTPDTGRSSVFSRLGVNTQSSTSSDNKQTSIKSRLGHNKPVATETVGTAMVGKLAATALQCLHDAGTNLPSHDLRVTLKRPATSTSPDSDDSDCSPGSPLPYAGVLKLSTTTNKRQRLSVGRLSSDQRIDTATAVRQRVGRQDASYGQTVGRSELDGLVGTTGRDRSAATTGVTRLAATTGETPADSQTVSDIQQETVVDLVDSSQQQQQQRIVLRRTRQQAAAAAARVVVMDVDNTTTTDTDRPATISTEAFTTTNAVGTVGTATISTEAFTTTNAVGTVGTATISTESFTTTNAVGTNTAATAAVVSDRKLRLTNKQPAATSTTGTSTTTSTGACGTSTSSTARSRPHRHSSSTTNSDRIVPTVKSQRPSTSSTHGTRSTHDSTHNTRGTPSTGSNSVHAVTAGILSPAALTRNKSIQERLGTTHKQ